MIHRNRAGVLHRSILISFYATFLITQLLPIFSILFTLARKGEETLLLPIRSEIRTPPRTRSIPRLLYLHSVALSRVLYVGVSRTVNSARITDVHFIDFRSSWREIERKNESERGKRGEQSLHPVSLARQQTHSLALCNFFLDIRDLKRVEIIICECNLLVAANFCARVRVDD